MALKTNEFDESGRVSVLAVVKSDSSGTGKDSLYVSIPVLDVKRRTDGGARDLGGGPVEYVGGIEQYDRNEYVTLTFRESKYSENHVLDRVERAEFSDPTNICEDTFPNTDISKVCPICGEEAAAIVKTEYDSRTGGKVSDTANACTVDPENRGSWFGLTSETTFVHGP